MSLRRDEIISEEGEKGIVWKVKWMIISMKRQALDLIGASYYTGRDGSGTSKSKSPFGKEDAR